MTTQVAFGKPYGKNGADFFVPRISEAVSESGTAASSNGSGLRGEVAEVTSTVAIWASITGAAAAGTTVLITAGGTKWLPVTEDGQTVSVITA